ncbi:MAG: EAL domain-containing protein [Gammaproteobacteria bacterium]|nr:EAL domain-containing protein [Gammaproteobacteria bacterium]
MQDLRAARHGKRILLAVPNGISRQLMLETFVAHGYEVAQAANAEAALKAVATQVPDRAILDDDLEYSKGGELALRLRRIDRATDLRLFLLLSPRSPPPGESGVLYAQVLAKPVEPDELVRWVDAELAARVAGLRADGRRHTVLLVDDNPVQLRMAGAYLTHAGFRVVTAARGREALDLAQKEPPDLVVADVLMPEVDGFTLCYALRRAPATHAVPVLLVTSHYVEDGDRRLAQRAGASGYVDRSAGQDELVRAIADCLRRKPPAPVLRSMSELHVEHQPQIVAQLDRHAAMLAAETRRNNAQAFVLKEIGLIAETLSRLDDAEPQLPELVVACLESAGLSRGVMFLRDAEGKLRPVACAGGDYIRTEAERYFGNPAIVQSALASLEPIRVPAGAEPTAAEQAFLGRTGAHSAALFAVRALDQILGVLVLFSTSHYLQQADWLPFGRALAAQLGATILRSRAWRKLKDSEDRLRSIFESASDAIFLTDDQGRILEANPATLALTGYELDALCRRNVTELVPAHAQARLLEALAPQKGSGGASLEVPFVTAGNEERTVHLRSSQVRPGLHVHVGTNITERKRAERQIHQLAFTDRVTELPNRTALRAQTERAIRQAAARGHKLSLLIVDLANFRKINSILGPMLGDMLLMLVARRLIKTLREAEIVARVGADEFAVLLPRIGEADQLQAIVDKVLAVFRPTFTLEDIPLFVRANIGVAVYPQHAEDPDALLRNADVALHAARVSGRPWALYDRATDAYGPRKLTLLSDLQQAIARNELDLHFQPQLSLEARAVAGVEALLRWNHPSLGQVDPAELVAVAEGSELVRPLTHWVVNAALRRMCAWRQAGISLQMTINVPAKLLAEIGLVQELDKLLTAANVPPSSLSLELSESALLDTSADALAALEALRALGVRLIMDDFGVGYSSLSQLQKLPLHGLTIDRSLIASLPSPGSQAIVRAAIALAHELGLHVTAEGVETKEALLALRDWRCDMVQGFLISPALPADEFEAWLRASPWFENAASALSALEG